jgi:hypothetical protein
VEDMTTKPTISPRQEYGPISEKGEAHLNEFDLNLFE